MLRSQHQWGPPSQQTQRRDRNTLGWVALPLLLAGLGLYLNLPRIATHFFTEPGIDLVATRDWTAAREKFTWAIRLNDNDAEAHFALAKLYEDRFQRPQKALKHYYQALQGNSLKAKNALARFYIRQQNNEAAVDLLLQLLKSADNETLPPVAEHAIRKNLAWAYLQTDNLEEAAAQLTLATALETTNRFGADAIANTHCLIAQILEAQGNRSAALPEWQTCAANANPTIPEQGEWLATAQDRLAEQETQPWSE